MAWRFIDTIYGRGASGKRTKYQTRIGLTPFTRWGHLRLHIFWRGDEDPDPHDHPFDFWTFPLTGSYNELMIDDLGFERLNTVPKWRWTYRPAEYKHRVLGPEMIDVWTEKAPRPRVFITLVWASSWKRNWGFWPKVSDGGPLNQWRTFIPWRKYLGE